METEKKGNKLFNKFLNAVETAGNKIPHPIILFSCLCVFIVLLSAILSGMGVSATGQIMKDGSVQESTATVKSLLNGEGFAWILANTVTNFTGYAALGSVIVAMLGVGVAEHSGLVNAVLKRTVEITPKKLICPVMVFLGVMSNIASDSGYVVLVPLGAMVFRAYGRHPMAGLAAVFAGVSGGFSANLMVGTLDPLLQGVSQEVVSMVDPTYEVNVLGNYYFMFVSVFLITFLGTIVTDRIVEPRLGKFDGKVLGEEDSDLMQLTADDRKGLTAAGWSLAIFIGSIVVNLIPADSFLRNPETGEIISSKAPIMQGIIVLIMLGFFIPGATFGLVSKNFKSPEDVCAALGKAMSSMGSFLALAFVASQFIKYFDYTNIGTVLAIQGAELIQKTEIGLIPLMVLFVLFSAFINLFMGGATSKWNIMAPVFVPMFMLLGYSPELAQLAYRIGDSTTNLITPLMTYFAIILIYAQKYDPKAGIGTLTATMLPYSIVFLVCWTIMMIIWLGLALPIGPGTSIFYVMGG